MSMNFGRVLRLLSLTLALLLPVGWGRAPKHLFRRGRTPLTGPNVSDEQLLFFSNCRATCSGRCQHSGSEVGDADFSRRGRNGGRSATLPARLKTVSAVVLLGMVAALVVFYMVRGKIRIDLPRLSLGRRIQRFSTGWNGSPTGSRQSSFLVLALTGLNLVFGRWLLLPLLGPETFATLTVYGKLAHNFLSFPFVLGIVLMLLIWACATTSRNGGDIAWIKAAGGLFS